MHYLNATAAALEIGISYRTIRRRIESRQIVAIRGEDGQYAIAASEVERLKKLQSERPMPVTSGQRESGQERTDLEQRVIDLEQRVRTLEAMTSRDQSPQQYASMPQTVSSTSDTISQTKPPIRDVPPNSPAPSDLLSARDFATKIGIAYTILDGYARRGIRGERMDITEVETTRKGYSRKYFTPEQQKRAVFLLRKHGKLS